MNSDATFFPLTPASISSLSRRVVRAFGLSVLIFLPITGCSNSEGPLRVPVSGQVMLDGQPLSSGVIRFIPQEGTEGPGAAAQIINGKFQFSDDDGPIAASHRVEIEATEFQGFAIDDEAAFAVYVQNTGRSPLASNPIPPIYNRASTLKAIVTDAEDQEFEFSLSSSLRHVVSH